MEKLLTLTTQLHNQTRWPIHFDVDQGFCPIRGLPSGETRSLNLSRIRGCCRERESPNWRIRVLINNEFTGMYVRGFDLLIFTRIVFRYELITPGSYELRALGIPEERADYFLRLKFFGGFLGRDIIWNKRSALLIAKANSKWTIKLRGLEDPNLVAPLVRDDTSLPQRQLAASSDCKIDDAREIFSVASPPQQERFRGREMGIHKAGPKSSTPDRVLNGVEMSTLTEVDAPTDERERRRRRDHERLKQEVPAAFQNMDSFVHVLLFLFALSLVCLVQYLVSFPV